MLFVDYLSLPPKGRNCERTVKRVPHTKKKSTCRRVKMFEIRYEKRT